jgi:hypothetical protein
MYIPPGFLPPAVALPTPALEAQITRPVVDTTDSFGFSDFVSLSNMSFGGEALDGDGEETE